VTDRRLLGYCLGRILLRIAPHRHPLCTKDEVMVTELFAIYTRLAVGVTTILAAVCAVLGLIGGSP